MTSPLPSYLSTSLLASLSPCNFRASSAQDEARDDRATGCIYTSRHPARLAADHHPLPAPFSLLCRKLRASPARAPFPSHSQASLLASLLFFFCCLHCLFFSGRLLYSPSTTLLLRSPCIYLSVPDASPSESAPAAAFPPFEGL